LNLAGDNFSCRLFHWLSDLQCTQATASLTTTNANDVPTWLNVEFCDLASIQASRPFAIYE
jgi:hypothetical protein